MRNKLLSIRNLKVSVDEQEILKGLDLEIDKGEIHVIMGPNGGGKSTLAYTLMGHPEYSITNGTVEFEGEVINDMKADERARKGIFLSFSIRRKYPVTVEDFLRTAKTSVTGRPQE